MTLLAEVFGRRHGRNPVGSPDAKKQLFVVPLCNGIHAGRVQAIVRDGGDAAVLEPARAQNHVTSRAHIERLSQVREAQNRSQRCDEGSLRPSDCVPSCRCGETTLWFRR